MATDKVRKYVLPNIPYLFIGWFCLKIGTAYRLAAGTGFGEKLLGLGQTIGAAFASFAPGLAPLDWFVGIVGAAGFRLLIYCKAKKAKKFRRDAEYGTARWGNEKDIKPFVDPKFENNMLLTATERLTMNTRPKNPANARNLNFCGIGSSGSGKTRFWLTPQLLQAHSSYVVVDPKGGVLGQVGAFLQRRGYQIKVFNSIDFSKSMHYNPFAYISKKNREKDILKFVDVLIKNTQSSQQNGGDDFWVKAEKLLYTAYIAMIFTINPPEEQNFETLIEMINSSECREDDETFQNAIDRLFAFIECWINDDFPNDVEISNEFQEMKANQPNEEQKRLGTFACKQYHAYKLAAGKTAKSILISCSTRLAPFAIDEVLEITSYDELGLDKLGDELSALFVIISDTDATFNFIVSIMYSQLFNLLCDKADDVYNGRLPIHVRCLLDEFANIGQIPQFEKLIATIRSREISASIILQSKSQLKALYRDNAYTIEGNCDTTLFLGGKEKDTLKDLAEILGKETIDLYNTSDTRGTSQSYGLNYQKTGKELMSQDEIAVMDGGKCIMQLRGVRPFFSNKFDITKHKQYHLLSDYDEKNAFDIEKYVKNLYHAKIRNNDTVDEVEDVGEIAA